MDNKHQTKKLPGFYIALCCCVLAIGIAGFFMQGMEDSQSTNALTEVEVNTPQPELPTLAAVSAPADPTEEPVQTYQPTAVPAETSAPTPVPANSYEYDNPDLSPASVVVQAEESGMFSDPVPGMTVLYGFSGGELMYNDILDDWRTHDGIDIEADVGCSVCAAAAGTVVSACAGTYGNTVTIEHDNGFRTVYAQLGEILVKEGDAVAAGDVIGSVAQSVGENTRQAHLHYEVHKDGKPVNPEEY